MFFCVKKKRWQSLILLSAVFGLKSYASTAITENSCTASPVDPPSGDVAMLQRELQRATNTGESVTITGAFTISSPIRIAIRRDLTVDASGASFTATSDLDGDMFSLDVVRNLSDDCAYSDGRLANVTWSGGSFQFTDAKNSGTVPIQSRVPADRQGLQSTADALSIRGEVDGEQRIDVATVENVLMRGTTGANQNFDDAGGDSGVFMSSIKHGIVKNSEFYGIRDAAIYVSANNTSSTLRSQYTITGNTIRRVFDGISSKRGADGIVVKDNTVTDSVVGISIKENRSGRLASNITFEDNTIIRSVRAILLENARNVRVNNNTISEMGGIVAGSNNPLGGNGRYRGVVLDGLSGTDNEVNGNKFEGINDPDNEKETVAVSSTVRNGVPNAEFERTNNTYTNIDQRLRNE